MTNEQKLERAQQLRREAAELEEDVRKSTPCCAYCDHIVVGSSKTRERRCAAFNQVIPIEFTRIAGNGCDNFLYDDVPY